MLIITFCGVTVLNGLTRPTLENKLPNSEMDEYLLPIYTHNKIYDLTWSPATPKLGAVSDLCGVNESPSISGLEASITSIMETLEKIQRIVNELRMLVETLHQVTQTFITLVKDLSIWFDRITPDSTILSSV